MTYRETLEYLFKQLPMYQREGKTAFKKDLNNTLRLCKLLGNPEQQFKSIHIAGTNGKGSTAHMLAAIFQEAGYRTGLYTSPHLKDFRERVRIDGEMISQKSVVEFVKENQSKFDEIKPSFFEWTVVLAFHQFAKARVDIAIIETGLGGRLDSTNVITPELSIITNISYDHMDMLGDTLPEIAREKAGIIKEGVPVVIGNNSGQKALFLDIAFEKKSLIYFADSLKTNVELTSDLIGIYQKSNIKTVFQSWLVLRNLGWLISFPQLERALLNIKKSTGLRGRWEVLQKNPLVIAETAHNEEGLKLAIKQLKETEYDCLHLVLGFVKGKDLKKLLSLFPESASFYFCEAKIPRAEKAEVVYEIAKELGIKGRHFNNVTEAKNTALNNAQQSDLVYIGGSNFVVAEAL
ncbi:MAG: folylpolyglutamate synthase/dihydrofolate synthase family protein [Vicingaceae bacterium]